jgi:hypothetical protein
LTFCKSYVKKFLPDSTEITDEMGHTLTLKLSLSKNVLSKLFSHMACRPDDAGIVEWGFSQARYDEIFSSRIHFVITCTLLL